MVLVHVLVSLRVLRVEIWVATSCGVTGVETEQRATCIDQWHKVEGMHVGG
jgi:hypothetical protein